MSHLPVISSASSARTTGYDGRERIGQGVLHPPPTLLLEVRTDNARRVFENESGRLPKNNFAEARYSLQKGQVT